MNKRLLLTTALLLSFISSISLWADTTGKMGENISWTLTSGGVLTINGSGDIPDYEYYSNNSPFFNNTEVKSAIIGEGITRVGNYCFYGCENLTNVKLPSTLKYIGQNAFEKCDFKTESIQLPEGLETIESNGFEECSLKEIILPSTLKTIGQNAFMNNFLTSITIPKSVTQIGYAPFYGANDIAEIIVEDGNTVYDSRNNCNAIIETSSNKLIAGCKNTVIPNTVKIIGADAFATRHELSAITIPNSVESIEDGAFYYCVKLSSISLPESLKTIGKNAFQRCYALSKVTMANNVESIGQEAFSGCSSLTSIAISNLVTTIENNTFYGCSKLSKVDLSSSLVNIGENAFFGCDLAELTIPASVTTIGKGAFNGCSNMQKINVLCPTPPTLGTDAFAGVSTDKVILQIPNGTYSTYTKNEAWSIFNADNYLRLHALIKDIKDNTTSVKFYYATTGLTEDGWNDYVLTNEEISIKFPGEVCEKLQKLGAKDPFNTAITSIELDKSMQECYHPKSCKQMFDGGKNISSITGLEYLNTDAATNMSQMFEECSSLTSLDLSSFDTKNVTTMANMFKNCNGLKDIYVSDKFNTDNIPDNETLFSGNKALKQGGKDVANYTTEGNFQKKVGTLGGDLIGAKGTDLSISYLNIKDGKDFVLTETAKVTSNNSIYTRKMTSTWGTLCLPFDINTSAESNNCKYYTIKSMSSDDITLEEVNTVSAGTPVLFCLNNTTSDIANIPGNGVLTANAKTDNSMTGTFTTQIVPDDAYFISKDAFRLASAYKGNGTNGVKVGAYRAYLKLNGIDEDGGYAKLLNIMIGETTAIDGIQSNSNNSNTEYFDITGKRINRLQKGLNIVKVGGLTKKVLVK